MPTGNEVSKDIYWLLRITWKNGKRDIPPSWVSPVLLVQTLYVISRWTAVLAHINYLKWTNGKKLILFILRTKFHTCKFLKIYLETNFNLQWWKVLILYHSSHLYHIFRKHLTMCNGISETSVFKLNSNSELFWLYTKSLLFIKCALGLELKVNKNSVK